MDTLLLYDASDDPAAVTRLAEELMGQGKTVRAERNAPQGLRYRELVRFGEGGQG